MDKEELIKEIKEKISSYPFDVVEGKITVCRNIRLCCERFIRFLDRDDMYFDVKAVEKVINFTKQLKHFKGQYAGKQFLLEDWQKFIYAGVYGFKWKKNKLRVTRTFILSIGRKNGKSSLLSAMALYALIADGEKGAECTIAANSAKQASILFDMASRYIKSVDPKEKYFRRFRDKILFDLTDSKIDVVSSDNSKLDGKNCSFAVVDEIAAAPDSGTFDILEESMGSRNQPLMCCCSTRGFQLSGFYKELEDGAIEVLEGVREDDSLFPVVYTLDKDDDWKDEEVWIKANPNLGVSLSKDFIKQQIKKSENAPSQEISIKTKLLNLWVSSSDTWIPMQYIYDSMKVVDINKFKDAYCFVGIDLSAVSDLTCITCLIENEYKYYVKNWYFLPSSALTNNPNEEKYKRWVNQGYLIATQGNVTDYDEVLKLLMKLQNVVPIQLVSYDMWNSTQWAISATEQGLPLQPYSQSIQSMNRPTKELERLIRSGKVIIDKNPITSFCFENAVPKLDWNDNIKIVKNSQMQKIDGVISIIMALGGLLSNQTYDNSIASINF